MEEQKLHFIADFFENPYLFLLSVVYFFKQKSFIAKQYLQCSIHKITVMCLCANIYYILLYKNNVKVAALSSH